MGMARWSIRVLFIYVRMPTKKAASPSHIAGAEVLENTYRKATYKWSRRCTIMTAHGIPFGAVPQTDKNRKNASVRQSFSMSVEFSRFLMGFWANLQSP